MVCISLLDHMTVTCYFRILLTYMEITFAIAILFLNVRFSKSFTLMKAVLDLYISATHCAIDPYLVPFYSSHQRKSKSGST